MKTSKILDMLNLSCLGLFPVYLSRQFAAAYESGAQEREPGWR